MNIQENWNQKISDELEFWKVWPQYYPEDYKRRSSLDCPLLPFVQEEVDRLSSPVRILDVGSGPMSGVGYKSTDGKPVEIVMCDPLADSFPDLYRKWGVAYPAPITACAEKLSETFRKCTFDIAYAQNAIDHTIDPVESIRQMCLVVKPGGAVILFHLYRCGTRNRWWGLHQWDLCIFANCLVVETRDSVQTVIDKSTVNANLEKMWLQNDGEANLYVRLRVI